MGLACLESSYGNSNFAKNRNNIFGWNAVDSNPGKASYFTSKTECVMFVAEKLSNNYLIYDNWYLTSDYMFSVKNLKKVRYKDIMVVESTTALVYGSGNRFTIGHKQTICLKNGKRYKLKSELSRFNEDIFTEIIKKKNSSVYFGNIEDYLKIKKNI